MNSKLEWHRNKVLELASKGNSQSDISKILRISQPTVNRDLSYLRRQAKKKMKEYINQKLPDEYEKCLVGLTSILKKAWNITSNAKNKREKIQTLSLAKDCYGMKLELLTHATVTDDAIRFVSEKQQQQTSDLFLQYWFHANHLSKLG